ncbi:MAG TPA: hypothetical protein VEH76_06335 [Methylocystis sp.]|nr:hypothetical protein [Methylocystis sp.]
MISSKRATFAKLDPKLSRAARELEEINKFLTDCENLAAAPDRWARTSATALGIHNVYNGIEDVMLSLALDVDGSVPVGDASHQDLLDQMSVAIEGKRPALLDQNLLQMLGELKGFRHIVRHRYGFDLDPTKVQENVERLRKAFPEFVRAVRELEQALART